MNKKRWTAIGIAVGLFLLSFASTYMIGVVKKETDQTDFLTGTYQSLFGKNQVSKTIIEDGSTDKQIAVLTVDGSIDSGGISGLSGGYNHAAFMQQLQWIEEDKAVKGIVLVVDSPGGNTFESSQIKDKLDEIKNKTKKPLYVSMQSVAASGGYFISANADKIFATEETITGSIGVVFKSLNYSGLYDKLGISDTTLKAGEHKDLMSSSRPVTDGDKAIWQTMLDDSYARFVNVIVEGREMDEARVRELADGRIYDGAKAKNVGLVDEIGYKEDAINAMKKDFNLKNAQVFEYQPASYPLSSLLFSKASSALAPEKNTVSELNRLIEKFGTVESPKMMYLYGGE